MNCTPATAMDDGDEVERCWLCADEMSIILVVLHGSEATTNRFKSDLKYKQDAAESAA